MIQVDSILTKKLADTLERHAAFDERSNPVLVSAARRLSEAGSVAKVIGQYSLLPATIVEFLQIGEARLSRWGKVREELKRNIGEELGSRTDGQTHYEILKTATKRELGLCLSDVKPTPDTDEFLNDIKQGLYENSPLYISGMIFALEASAIPELTVVARIINEYAALTGHIESPITLSGRAWKTGDSTGRESGKRYTLNSFFAAHLFDFEIGHKNRLAEALGAHLTTLHELAELEEGFESVLCLMDRWWEALAGEIRGPEAVPLLTVARQRVIAPLSANILLLEPGISR